MVNIHSGSYTIDHVSLKLLEELGKTDNRVFLNVFLNDDYYLATLFPPSCNCSLESYINILPVLHLRHLYDLR